MTCISTGLETIQKTILPGDVIAFGGTSKISKLIKLSTGALVSHVGIVVKTPNDNSTLSFMEATIADEKVVISNLFEKMATFNGNIWLLSLKRSLRASFNLEHFQLFLHAQHNKPYDTRQALESAFDFADHVPLLKRGLTYAKEDFNKIFCSELVAGSLEASGIIKELNASEVTPIEICNWDIFEDKYYRLKGKDTLIGFDSEKI